MVAASISAAWSGGTLALRLHYEMTCGQPGPGPVAVQLPNGLRPAAAMRATADGRRVAVRVADRTVTIALPRPPEVTCMSITPGTLRLALEPVHCVAPPGDYPIRARLRTFTFATTVRLP